MKIKIDGLIIVEGKTDIVFLSSFIDADFYSVNGSAVDESDFEFIKKYKDKGTCIVLTDPDYPGKKIRQAINREVPGVFNAYVKKECSIKKNKVGVAESTKEEVINALQNVVCFSDNKIESNLTANDLLELGLIGPKSTFKRDLLCEKMHIGHSNAKQLLKKLRMLGFTKEDIEGYVK